MPTPAADSGHRTYVLDTNVLLHDPTALYKFKEHDVGIPLVVLEELDKHKKGVADLARNARQVTRTLGAVVADAGNAGAITDGFSLKDVSNGACSGRLYFLQSLTGKNAPDSAPAGLIQDKPDNLILACVQQLRKTNANAILVTKDINLRVKALALSIPAEDYRSDRVLEDADLLERGYIKVDESFWLDTDAAGASKNGSTMRTKKALPTNSFVIEATSKKERLWRVDGKDGEGQTKLTIVKSEAVNSKIKARSIEQSMALELLHDTDIDFVAILGKAGSGKTLLALAAGIDQVEKGIYDKVMITRATVPMGEDIGFLPGTEEQKMEAWLGGTVDDCFAALGKAGQAEALRAKVEIPSMNFMRGRSFQRQFIIIDEAQNLTPKQMQALITRSGNDTKVIVTGNVAQIDSPYLDAGSSGLTWAAKLLYGWEHAGVLILPRGERSRLATFVEDQANGGEGSTAEEG